MGTISTLTNLIFLSFIGKSSGDTGSLPFIHVEPDIELASRSADSTEDSLPDQLSPDAADKSAKKKFKYSKSEGDHPESDDDLSSTESEFTSSDELSSDDEAEDDDGDNKEEIGNERESKVFVPINIPNISTETVAERKKPLKGKGRRCRSESDKNLLMVDEKFTTISRDSSVSKFKPDGSWIKPVSESETDNNENIASEVQVTEESKVDDTGGLWMGVKPEKECKDITEGEKEESLVEYKAEEACDQMETESIDSTKAVEQKCSDPYERENIPWYPGMVKKQTKDIEKKYNSSVVKKRDSGEGSEEKPEEIPISENTQAVEKEIVTEETKNEGETEKVMSDDSESQSDKELIRDDKVVKLEVDRGSESPKLSQEMKKSVYEEEEIDLPEGIVRKTTMEIEERNR